MKKLYIVRHGETNWNKEGRTQGRSDSQLTAQGLCQARGLARALEKEGIEAIYSSTLKRAASTAMVIGQALNIPIYNSDELVEIGFGQWEGLTLQEIQAQFPNQLKGWHQAPHRASIPGGEGISMAQKRIKLYIDYLIKNCNLERVLIVSHGTIIKLYLMALLEMNLSQFYKLKQNNCAINVIEFKRRGPVLIKYNDTAYREIMLEDEENGQ